MRGRAAARRRRRRLRRCCGWLFALVLLLPELAFGARLTAVRIGLHSEYARVVLETDAPADFVVVDAAPTQNEVVIRIAATSRAREVKSALAGTPVVVLVPQDDGATLARIRAPGPLRVETQVLAAPPRVVLDLHPATGEAVSTPEPAPQPAAAPPVDPPVTELEAAVVPEPETAGSAEPAASPPPIADGEPAPAPVETPPSARADAPLPSVAAPPPAARTVSGLDARSLAMGFALGVGLVLLGFVLRRPRSVAPEPTLPPLADFDIEAPDPLVSSSDAEPSADFHWVSLDSADLPDAPPPSTEPPDPLVPRSEAKPSGELHEAAPAPSTEPLDALVPRSEAKPSGEPHEAAPAPSTEPPDPLVPRSEAEPSGEPHEPAPAPSTEPPDPLVPRSEAKPSGELHEAAPAPSTEPLDPLVPRSEAKPSGEPHEIAPALGTEPHESDLFRMHQRLDARLAEIADRLGELVERQLRLEARGSAQNEELASQRAAIARLQRSLRPKPVTAPPLQVP